MCRSRNVEVCCLCLCMCVCVCQAQQREAGCHTLIPSPRRVINDFIIELIEFIELWIRRREFLQPYPQATLSRHVTPHSSSADALPWCHPITALSAGDTDTPHYTTPFVRRRTALVTVTTYHPVNFYTPTHHTALSDDALRIDTPHKQPCLQTTLTHPTRTPYTPQNVLGG